MVFQKGKINVFVGTVAVYVVISSPKTKIINF
jgi:hypothetical protein